MPKYLSLAKGANAYFDLESQARSLKHCGPDHSPVGGPTLRRTIKHHDNQATFMDLIIQAVESQNADDMASKGSGL